LAERKPFAATRSRLERARREGDLPRVGEFVGACAYCAAFVAASAVAPPAVRGAAQFFSAMARGRYDREPAPLLIGACVLAVLSASAAVAVLAAAAASGGFRFRLPSPELRRLDPVSGVKRIVSREAVWSAARGVLAVVVVTAALVPVVREAFVAALGASSAPALSVVGARSLRKAVLTTAVLALGIAALDAVLERTKWRERLRMSFDEFKRDMKESEGDPALRGRRTALHKSMLTGSTAALREAAFVVTNPTHVAVALAYRPPDVAVPRIVVNARGAVAKTVKAAAREFGLPIVEEPMLARRLSFEGDVGGYIPRPCYQAVAQVVAALLDAGLLD
jgi:flagellar biosynthetic protein FlhB